MGISRTDLFSSYVKEGTAHVGEPMLLTSLILSSSLADLSLVKSRVVEAVDFQTQTSQVASGELARFEDRYGRQFTVIRGSVDSELSGDRFSDHGYAVCRYDKHGVLDRVEVSYSADAQVGGRVIRNPVSASGILEGNTFVTGVKNGAPLTPGKVTDYRTKAPHFSLLEAVVLFEYRPNGEPMHLLNMLRVGGQPAVLPYRFAPAEPTGALAQAGTCRELYLAVQPQSNPRWILSGGALDRSGTVYLASVNLIQSGDQLRQSERGNSFVYDGSPVKMKGEVAPEDINALKSLVPADWRTPPTD